MCHSFLALILAAAGPKDLAAIYVTHTGYHDTWQPFVAKLATLTPIERGKGPEIPERLDQRRLVLISGDVKRYSKDRARLLRFVEQGGTLLFWFIDDERNEPDFFPFKLKNTNDDAGVLTFTNNDHPLLEGLRGKTIKNGEQGGDVVRDWDKDRWIVLGDTPAGPAMLVGKHGQGHILICQFSTGFAKHTAIHERLAVNLAAWLKLPKWQ